MFREGQIIIYLARSFDGQIYKAEIGKIKRICEDEKHAFIYFNEGDTASRCALADVLPITNDYTIKTTSLGGL